MTLGELLRPERVLVPLRAASLAEAVRRLADAAVSAGLVTDASALDAAMARSWPEDTVALGHAYLPHFRTDAVDDVVVVLGIAPEPLRRGAAGDRGSRIVLLVLAPRRAAAAYLQTVAAFARVLAQPDVVAALLAAPDAASVLALAALRDARVGDQLRVRDLMTPDVIAVTPDTRLGEAARLLLAHGVEALPVLGEAGQVVGMLTNRELVRVLVPEYVQRGGEQEAPRRSGAHPVPPEDRPVRDVMQRSVLCLSADQTVAEVAQLLMHKDLDRFPVTRDGVLCGFLTRADIVRKVVGTI